MPGLSSSTLNLKFMQRAAARTPTSAPSTPGPSTPQQRTSTPRQPENSTSRTDGPKVENQDEGMVESTPGTAEEARLIASEEPFRWTLGRTPTNSKPSQTKSTGVKFESSYLPFIPQASYNGDSSSETEAEAGPSTRAGGGRMVFGYKEPEQEDLEKEGDDDEEGEEGDVVVNVRDKEKERKGRREGRRPVMSEKGFMKPRHRSGSPDRAGRREQGGSLIPTTTTSRGHGESSKQNQDARPSNHGKSKMNGDSSRSTGRDRDVGSLASAQVKNEPQSSQPSQATKQSTSNQTPKTEGKNRKRKPSQSSSTDQARAKSNQSTTGLADKKPKLSPSMLNDYPTQSTQPTSTSETNRKLDEREQALKAQKKKEKNARKKARKSAEGA